jgi:hypothetical protein
MLMIMQYVIIKLLIHECRLVYLICISLFKEFCVFVRTANVSVSEGESITRIFLIIIIVDLRIFNLISFVYCFRHPVPFFKLQ